jgi:deoxyribonuclease-1
MKTPAALVALFSLLGCLQAALASPLSELMKVYPHGGKTLYCHATFAPDGPVRIDYIYSKSALLEHFNCITMETCTNNKEFQKAYNDLHNLYPVELGSLLARSGTFFGFVPDSVAVASKECPFRTSFQTFDPPDYAKGNVARAMVYMSEHYHLPILGSLVVYKRWNQLDPPDQEETDRNNAIKALEGTSNPYIDNPSLMDKLDSRSGNSLQMNFQ